MPPESELERHLYRLLGRPSVPPFDRQPGLPWNPHGPQRVDALIPSWRLIVEADGRRWHTRAQDFERDRARDVQALSHGYRTIRFGWAALTEAPDEAFAQLVSAGCWTMVEATPA